jgi:4-hydroxy-tetrahydrodipicolinate reductase
MGSTIADLAQQDPEVELAGVLERPDMLEELQPYSCPKGAEPGEMLSGNPNGVVIDFTSPEATVKTAEAAARCGNPMVVGTTGFDADQQKRLTDAAARVPVFWAPNMSVGINVLLRILPELARMLGLDYDTDVSEIHHKHKKDAPSGTAKQLARELASAKGWDPEAVLRFAREGMIGEREREEIGVQSLRGGDVVGEHTVYFFGPGERIDVTHRVYSRSTFAQGALRAAKWIRTRSPGRLYSMADLFSDQAG